MLVDAVGVTETQKTASQPLERKRTVSFDKLLDQIAQGRRDDDAVSSLASRLAALDHQIDDNDRARIAQTAEGVTLRQLAHRLLNAIEPDVIQAEAVNRHGESANVEQTQAIADDLKDNACAPLDDAELRKTLVAIKRKTDTLIDELTTDRVISAEYDLREAEERVASFREFIETHKDELLALQILYGQPYAQKRLTYDAIKELAQKLTDAPYHLTTADVWQAYKRLHASLVRGAPADNVLTDIIALVRFATAQTDVLEPYSVAVRQRFNLWIGRQKKAGRQFSEEQMHWLNAIRDYLAANVEIEPADLMRDHPFTDWGGIVAARGLFGDELAPMLDELGEALAA